MSRMYRMIIDAERIKPRREWFRKSPRDYRETDRTNESPLMEAPDCPLWHVAMTEPRREQAAITHLRNAGWIAWYPQQTITRELAAKRERALVNVPLFHRYIFVAGSGSKPIGDCRHVSTLLPYRVSPSLISDLQARQSKGEFRTAQGETFEPGQYVMADIGQFAALKGIVREVNHERVRILVSMFGSERVIEADARKVKAA